MCDEAERVLSSLKAQMLEQFGEAQSPFFNISLVDIAESDDLVNSYGTRIPVLLSHDLTKELSWPFDEPGVYQFMMDVLNKR